MADPPSGDLNEVEDIFAAALSAGDAARSEVLDARCGERTDIRAEVESLLTAHARAGHFITSPAFEAMASADAGSLPSVAPGMRVGAFRLLQPIARGGMGEVFKGARVDGDFTQTVAIKLIAVRFAGADTLRRFRSERQILAELHHPNIVALLDGGLTDDGQPYIVMEYVDGESITSFCSRHNAALEDRLRLFQQLCAAVHFAHRHLIVHRDLKPANVLVTSDGIVKVLDFGIAKLLDERDPSYAATMPLMRPMTTNYASPEQIRGMPVTTTSDVYGLGVILYELLTGRRPYETAGKTLDELVELVLHRDPVRPSSTVVEGQSHSSRALAGDLDAIVLKAMAKDPVARYASAAELSEDVGCFLAGAPVVAREPSLSYLARKTIARHRGAFAVAAVSLGFLVAALVGALWQARVAADARARADQRFNDVRELAGALIFKIHDEVAPLAGSTPVRRTVVEEGLKFLERLEQESSGDPALQVELANAYIRIGNVQGQLNAGNLGDRDAARRSYRRALALAMAAASPPGASTEPLATAAQANLALSATLDGDESLAAVRSAHDFAAAWHKREPAKVPATELYARASFFLALRLTGAEQLKMWLETDDLYKSLLKSKPDSLQYMRNVALTQKYIGGFYEADRNFQKSLEHDLVALALDRTRVSVVPEDRNALLDLAISIGAVAYAQRQLGDYEQALAGYRESLGIRERISAADPKDVYARGRVAWLQMSIAWVYEDMRRLDLGWPYIARAIELNAKLPADEPAYRTHRGYADATLGRFEAAEGRHARACEAFARARNHWRANPSVRADEQEELDKVLAALDKCGA